MKKYEVTLRETTYGSVEVLARNTKEAKEIAEEMWSDGMVDMLGKTDCVATDATVI